MPFYNPIPIFHNNNSWQAIENADESIEQAQAHVQQTTSAQKKAEVFAENARKSVAVQTKALLVLLWLLVLYIDMFDLLDCW